jgi:hypothetical protein
MSEVRLGASWAYRGQNRRAERDRLLRLVDALRPIHPFLHEFSWTGKRSGWKPRLAQPDIRLLTYAQWDDEVFKEETAILARQFWNRRKPNEEGLSIWLSIFDPPPDYLFLRESGISFPWLPDALVTEPILTAMLEAVITTMQPDQAEIGRPFRVMPTIDKTTLSDTEMAIIRQRGHDLSRPDWAEWRERAKQLDGGSDTPVWRFWLANGISWPRPDLSWLESWQSEPADEEQPFLDGTLYTWQKYAPWNLPEESDWKRPSPGTEIREQDT